MIKINTFTEIVKPYVKGIKSCSSQEELKTFIKDWKEIAKDSSDVINSNDFDYSEFKRGMLKEKQGIYSGDEWTKKYGAILLPRIILFIGIKANQLHVPEGLVFKRCVENNLIKKDSNGFYNLKELEI